MLQTLKNAWKIPELRKKLLFTLFILLIYRLGSVIPVPFIDVTTLANYFDSVLSSTILGLYNAMSGSAFSRATVLALGIQPYINASIIVQLLTVAIPALERLAKDGGEDGKKKIERITRYTTVGLGLLMGWAYYMMLRNYSSQISIITSEGLLPALVIILAFTAGSALVMWLGEQITEFGIGNGISMILFANIISSIPGMVGTLATLVWWQIIIVLVGIVALVLFIVFINDAERRIPIQYAKRVVGRKVYGGQNTNLPIKVAMSGVMPIIFAQSICSLPATICAFTGKTSGWWYDHVWSSSSWIYAVIYFIMIFFFSWFYSTIQYDTVEISNNLKSNGGFIPGFRPGMVPMGIINKMYRKGVVAEEAYRTASKACFDYIETEKLTTVGDMIPSQKQQPLDFDNDTEYEFVFEVGIAPEVQIGLSKKDKVTKYTIRVEEKMREGYRSNFLRRFGRLVDVEKVEKEEALDVTLEQGDTKIEEAYVGLIGMSDEDRAPFVGKKVGDTMDVDIAKLYKTPSQRASVLGVKEAELEGMDPNYRLTITKIRKFAEPELNEEFFKTAFPDGGVKTAEEFEQYVTRQIEGDLARESGFLFSIDVRKVIDAVTPQITVVEKEISADDFGKLAQEAQ